MEASSKIIPMKKEDETKLFENNAVTIVNKIRIVNV